MSHSSNYRVTGSLVSYKVLRYIDPENRLADAGAAVPLSAWRVASPAILIGYSTASRNFVLNTEQACRVGILSEDSELIITIKDAAKKELLVNGDQIT